MQYIIHNVIQSLLEDPTRKFIYVEMAFFMRWWREQNEAKKQQVRDLVKNGQLEFINGGWSMNGECMRRNGFNNLDEASTLYPAVIDQMTLGHEFLLKEFNYKPTIGWHIGSFPSL